MVQFYSIRSLQHENTLEAIRTYYCINVFADHVYVGIKIIKLNMAEVMNCTKFHKHALHNFYAN